MLLESMSRDDDGEIVLMKLMAELVVELRLIAELCTDKVDEDTAEEDDHEEERVLLAIVFPDDDGRTVLMALVTELRPRVLLDVDATE